MDQYGEDEARTIVQGWIDNDVDVMGNDVLLLEAVDAGTCDVAIVNHYYLARELDENPDLNVELYWASQEGKGVMENISGARRGVHLRRRGRRPAAARVAGDRRPGGVRGRQPRVPREPRRSRPTTRWPPSASSPRCPSTPRPTASSTPTPSRCSTSSATSDPPRPGAPPLPSAGATGAPGSAGSPAGRASGVGRGGWVAGRAAGGGPGRRPDRRRWSSTASGRRTPPSRPRPAGDGAQHRRC